MKVTYLALLLVVITATGCSTAQKKSSAPVITNQEDVSQTSSAPKPPVETDFSYIIGPGDVIKISVWRHPDLMNEITVQPDGKISFPIVHEVKAAGLTPAELENTLSNSLSRIIKDPDVAISVTYFGSQKIFVLGEVGRAGIYPFPGNITILDAISYAGGYLDSAALDSIVLIRGGTAKRINLAKLLNKADFSQNVPLLSGDIIFVPKSFIAQIDKFVDLFFTKTDPVLKYYLDALDIRHYNSSNRVRY